MRSLRPLAILLALSAPATAADFPKFNVVELDPHVGEVCYAVTTADVDGDGKRDVVALTEDSVVYFTAPRWDKHVILKGQTKKDNVCIQPHDVDGDGRIDFALGADWHPGNTESGGTLQIITRTGASEGAWRVIPLAEEPTIHRLRWGSLNRGGPTRLVVAPLQGRGTKGPDWGKGQGSRILVYTKPDKPFDAPWPVEVADDTLHTIHNLQVTDFDDNQDDDVVVAAWEGVFILRRDNEGRWSKEHIGTGNQENKSSKGAGEVKVGRLADGRKYIATIEPWHGSQVVVYTQPPKGKIQATWDRQVIDEPLTWGHAVWCADLDGDGDDELIIGQRDPSKSANRTPKGPGILIYDPEPRSDPLAFKRHVLEDGGVAVEDLLADDLDGDGKPEIIAGGRASHNVRIYMNLGPSGR
jgi:hypothetical protein